MRIIGIDPGYAIVGYGIIDVVNSNNILVDYGVITTSPKKSAEKRLLDLYTGINYLNIEIANSGSTTTITFDMTDVNGKTGLPVLSLPEINTSGTATVLTQEPSTDTGFVGWITPNNAFLDATEAAAVAVGTDTSG